ncbi:MAG TPA: CRISPR-associated protein Csx19 [Candidatus Syntrophosphaera sp.]|nr:CRISPR-associated protein Csx19 [Candidatus Syntrophosphaera sp.]HRS74760.1 CRISPR-associated protein Csx19 [Anaerolineaceae bacterium]
MKAQHSIQTVSIAANFASEPVSVLEELARAYNLRWLLAHADDGVIWGELRADGLHLSGNAFPDVSPSLRAEMLQQARLFGPQGEILLWKENAAWRGRLIQDEASETEDAFDETHLLWGTEVEERRDGFTLLREGREGLRHAPPLPDNAQLPVRLGVRHYVAYDANGQAYIPYSRLTGIDARGGEQ